MKSLMLAAFLLAASAGAAAAQTACPSFRTVVYIHGAPDAATRRANREKMIDAVGTPNTIVRLTPDVDFDFSDVAPNRMPVQIARCSQLVGVAEFGPPQPVATDARAARGRPAPALRSAVVVGGAAGGLTPPPPPSVEGRSSRTLGPVLRYGHHNPPLADSMSFLQATCDGGAMNEGTRIAGFRLYGPSFGDQTTSEVGIRIEACHDAEVSNMEIAGWAAAGVEVKDPTVNGTPSAEPAGGIRVLIHDSYFHDNKHPTDGGTLGGLFGGGTALGYGVVASQGGFLRVYQSVFDNNRHAVAADAHAGGYHAERNLILEGGGEHKAWYETYTHIMDAHGTGWRAQGGDAGRSFLIRGNVFQYTNGSDIHMRGNPLSKSFVEGNTFARSDEGDAIDGTDNSNFLVRPDNIYNVNDYGRYQVCDFDGDGVDDLFFATGRSWWFSGQGRFAWTFLRADNLPRSSLRLGYFDGDARCDVLAEFPADSGKWFISSGGATNPLTTQLGSFGHPLKEVVFGRFDPKLRDTRPGVTRQATHAFWRRADGQWFVTPLNQVAWTPVQSSSFPLDQLKFGDFTGNGGTDVLAVVNGHWAISQGGTQPWRQINTLGDPVGQLYVANMDADDNIDDLLKVVVQVGPGFALTWWRSKNGVEPWKVWKTYTFPLGASQAGFAFAGRFGPNPLGGATLTTDGNRRGQFASRSATWQGLAPY
jgi:hypothetical protein